MGRLILIILVLFSVTAIYSEVHAAEYRVMSQENDKPIPYRANDFYSIYYVYFNVIQALEVENHLTSDEIHKVVFETIDNLKQHRFSQLQISGYKGPEPLRVTLRTDSITDQNKPILWLISNYNHEKKAVVTGEALKHAYGTYFYLIGDKLVKYQRIKQPKTKAQIAALPANSRADYYLLDEKADNDQLGKRILINALDKPNTAQTEQVLLNLTLSQYHLLDGNLKGAEVRVDKARDILRQMPRQERHQLRVVFHYGKELVDLYREYHALKA